MSGEKSSEIQTNITIEQKILINKSKNPLKKAIFTEKDTNLS